MAEACHRSSRPVAQVGHSRSSSATCWPSWPCSRWSRPSGP